MLNSFHFKHVILFGMFSLFILNGCGQKQVELSLTMPDCMMDFQECPVQMDGYKSPQQRHGQNPDLLLAIAASGGGFRAANFTAGVMMGLEQLKFNNSNALLEIDYMSTVSGGGFTTAVYMSSLKKHIEKYGNSKDFSFTDILSPPNDLKCPYKCGEKEDCLFDPCIKSHLQGFYRDSKDHIVDDLFAWLFGDKGGHLQTTIDDYLFGYYFMSHEEDKVENSLAGHSLKFGDIFISDNSNDPVTLPIWVANATVYQNGSIFPFTPSHFKLYDITGYRHRCGDHIFNSEKESYEEYLQTVPMSLAVTASANFPFATMPTTLKSSLDKKFSYVHLLDGGFADNLAVITAARVLTSENDQSKKILIVIDAFNSNLSPFSFYKQPPHIANVLRRSMDISLDSWRGRYREFIERYCGPKGICIISLGFEELFGLEDIMSLKEFGLSDDDIIELTKDGEVNPFALLRNIPTLILENDGRLTDAQQNLLIAAGVYAVDKNKDEIISSMRN